MSAKDRVRIVTLPFRYLASSVFEARGGMSN
jgi:hypothetical protein